MTKKKDPNALPLRVHKATQQAYVIVDGSRHYLGRRGTPDSQARYDKFLVEWIANGRRLRVESSDLTIVELKRQKLKLKDEIEKLKTGQTKH